MAIKKQSTPLPTPAMVQISNMNTGIEPMVMSAYMLCYDEEQRLLEAQNEQTEKPLIHIRILGWMFVYNLGSSMLIKLAEAVTVSHDEDVTYDQLGEFFLNYWIRPFRIRARTPYSSHPSRPACEAKAVDLAAVLKEPNLDHKGAKALALERDGYRCILTGILDTNSVATSAVQVTYNEEGKPLQHMMETQCARIFSKSANESLSNERKKLYAGRAWAVLEGFGYGEILGELNGSDVNRLENVLTLENSCHSAFDNLWLWLEATEPDNPESHSYNIRTYRYYSHPSLPASVTFTNRARPEYRDRIPLPSKKYLRVHAACCGVAAMSGAGEYLDKVMRDQERINVLSADGGSSDVAVNAVWKAFYSVSK
ncbi:hypothetical protein BDY19DRAFT_83186 [Irpex rosettiformis]|uniref:Uncharacterized protein n=1 Tax=Irpex rosettiformis TaxID=378272 RepID=A0ACB8U697_9APHY|nr:hypothetical protein BDY19DRAFT_83186 [Irpex rosettiformis]